MLELNLRIYQAKLAAMQKRMGEITPPTNQDEADEIVEIYKAYEKMHQDFNAGKPPLTLIKGGKP